VARGGTGTASPSLVAGTNISISGTWPNQTVTGTTGAPTTAQVLAAIAGASAGDVGTYGQCGINNGGAGGTNMTLGSNYAGSSLMWFFNADAPSPSPSNARPSGTWKFMGATNTNYINPNSVMLRVA
jgi:hypothetical protein